MDSIYSESEAVRLFSDIHKIMKQCMRKSFEEVGLTAPQSLVLHSLSVCGPMKISELGAKVNLSKSTVSGIIDRLEKKEYVIRTRDEVDRRIVYVKVSDDFEDIHQKMHQKLDKSLGEIIHSGSPEELEQIVIGLRTLKKVLEERRESNQC